MRVCNLLLRCTLLLLAASTAALAQGRTISSFNYQQNFDWVGSATTAFPTTDTDGGEFTPDASTASTWVSTVGAGGLAPASGGGGIRMGTTATATQTGFVWYGDMSLYCADSLTIRWDKVANTPPTGQGRVNELRIATNGGSGSTFTDLPLSYVAGGAWPSFTNNSTAEGGVLRVALPSFNGRNDVRVRIYTIEPNSAIGSGNRVRVTVDSLRIIARGGNATPPNLVSVTGATTSSVTVNAGTSTSQQNFQQVLLVRSTSATNSYTPPGNFGNWTAGQGLNSTDTVVYFGRLSTQTDTSFVISGLPQNTTYYFRAWGFTSCSTRVSTSYDEVSGATSPPNTPANITVDPRPDTVCEGDPATFSVTVTGTGPFTYQWRKNGAPISGATNSTLVFANARDTDDASYSVIVRGVLNPPDTSAAGRLLVHRRTVITSEPTGRIACSTGVALRISTVGTGPLTFRWYRNGTLLTGGDSVRSINFITAADTGSYRVIVQGVCNSDTSAIAYVGFPAGPSISRQPANATECIGSFADFSVRANGGGLRYQWRKDGTPITGATDTLLHIYPIFEKDRGSYDVMITDSCGNVIYSTRASLSTNDPILFTEVPTSHSVHIGDHIDLKATATGTGPIAMQWYRNGTAIPGATSSTYTITYVIDQDLGEYYAMATNVCGSTPSASAYLYLQPAPSIITQPGDATGCEGDTLTLRVGATGFGITYQWKKNGTPVPGATGSSLVFAPATPADSGTYTVVVTGQSGETVTSDPADLIVNGLARITTQPSTAVGACGGEMLTLTVGTTGQIQNFQWRRNGQPIPGANGATYNVVSVTAADSGSYDVVITGLCDNTVTSNASTVHVTMPAQITTNPVSTGVREEDSLTLYAAATGDGLRYQWRKDGTPIPGAIGPSYTVGSFTSANVGNYDVIITGACGEPDTSTIAIVTLDASGVRFGSLGATTRVSITPNPTHATARIEIESDRTLLAARTIHLAVVDPLGREVADLTDRFNAGDRRAVTFDGSALLPGVYYCRLTLDGESRTLGSIVIAR